MKASTIVCAILSAYAIYVDLTATTLRSNGDAFQTGPMTIWGAIVSVVAVVEILLVFRSQIRKEANRLRKKRK